MLGAPSGGLLGGGLAACDNTSRPGFRVDPPFAWETAHEAYFGAERAYLHYISNQCLLTYISL